MTNVGIALFITAALIPLYRRAEKDGSMRELLLESVANLQTGAALSGCSQEDVDTLRTLAEAFSEKLWPDE